MAISYKSISYSPDLTSEEQAALDRAKQLRKELSEWKKNMTTKLTEEAITQKNIKAKRKIKTVEKRVKAKIGWLTHTAIDTRFTP
jgi:predicted  nucleic acid-binding Zn-ribbon protein